MPTKKKPPEKPQAPKPSTPPPEGFRRMTDEEAFEVFKPNVTITASITNGIEVQSETAKTPAALIIFLEPMNIDDLNRQTAQVGVMRAIRVGHPIMQGAIMAGLDEVVAQLKRAYKGPNAQ